MNSYVDAIMTSISQRREENKRKIDAVLNREVDHKGEVQIVESGTPADNDVSMDKSSQPGDNTQEKLESLGKIPTPDNSSELLERKRQSSIVSQ